MINILEAAILSAHVYKKFPFGKPSKKSEHFFGLKITGLDKNEIKAVNLDNDFALITDYKPNSHPANEFYAQLYVKFVSGKAEAAVLAFRGTVARMVGNDIVDVVTWYQDVMGIGKHYLKPFYFPIIIDYYLAAKDYLNAHFHHLNPATSLYLTGHSLGGAMAKMASSIKLARL